MEVFEFEEDAAGGEGWPVSVVEEGGRGPAVRTILQLWREQRTQSEGSRPRAWGGQGMVGFPCLKFLGFFGRCCRSDADEELLKGSLGDQSAEGRRVSLGMGWSTALSRRSNSLIMVS